MLVIAGRYARALFRLSKDRECLDQVAKEARQMLSWMNESQELKTLAHHKLSKKNSVKDVFSSLFERAKFSKTTAAFVYVLIERSRLYLLRKTLLLFLTLVDEDKGLMRGHITTVTDLPQSNIETLNTILTDKLKKKVLLSSSVNPDILGGIVLRVGPYLIDSSLESRLSRLEARLKG